jgi:hypothetical protein
LDDIIDMIDHVIDDTAVSADAMRWTPQKYAPVERAKVGEWTLMRGVEGEAVGFALDGDTVMFRMTAYWAPAGTPPPVPSSGTEE